MQKLIRWLLGGLVVFSLAACGPAGGEGDDEDGGTSVQQQQGEEEDD